MTDNLASRIWVTVTQESGEFVAAFATAEAALQHYDAVVRNTYEGAFQSITGIGVGKKSYAYPSLTRNEAAFGEDPDEEIQFGVPGWHILLWNPLEGNHVHLLLRSTELY